MKITDNENYTLSRDYEYELRNLWYNLYSYQDLSRIQEVGPWTLDRLVVL